MDNPAGDMEVFAQAAQLGGVSAAGRKLGVSLSAMLTRVSARLLRQDGVAVPPPSIDPQFRLSEKNHA